MSKLTYLILYGKSNTTFWETQNKDRRSIKTSTSSLPRLSLNLISDDMAEEMTKASSQILFELIPEIYVSIPGSTAVFHVLLLVYRKYKRLRSKETLYSQTNMKIIISVSLIARDDTLI